MDSKEYVKLAIVTESQPEKLPVNLGGLRHVLILLAVSAGIADTMKRGIFYGKGLDQVKLAEQLHTLKNLAEQAAGRVERVARPEDAPTDLHQPNLRIVHGGLGVFSEAGETLEALIKQIETGELDLVNVGEEALGDVPWYQAVISDETGVTFEQGWETNIAKLKKRYGEKFSSEAALNRDLDGERAVLEQGLSGTRADTVVLDEIQLAPVGGVLNITPANDTTAQKAA